MKKILMGLTALLALSFAAPAFAEEAAPAGDKAAGEAKPAKKKGKKKAKAEGDAAKPAEAAPAK